MRSLAILLIAIEHPAVKGLLQIELIADIVRSIHLENPPLVVR